MSQDLVTLLIGKQTAENLSGQEMAVKLGISPGYWSHIQNRNRGLSRKVIRRAVENWPDLTLPAATELLGTVAAAG